jgi:hypothetical protein
MLNSLMLLYLLNLVLRQNASKILQSETYDAT